jgi:hypothetical protein
VQSSCIALWWSRARGLTHFFAVYTTEQIADPLTKPLGVHAFKSLRLHLLRCRVNVDRCPFVFAPIDPALLRPGADMVRTCGRNTGTEESKGGGIRSEESKADTPSVLAPVRGARRGITSSGMGGDDADDEDGRAPV